MGAFDVPDGRSAVKCRSTPRRRPIRRCHGARLKSAGDDGENDQSRRRARAMSRSQRRGGRTGMDDSTKDLTSSARFASPIMSRAEPSRAEPSRAEPSRAEPSRAEPSRAEPSRAEPSRAEPSRAEPSRAEPSRAEPSRAEPSRAPLSPPRSRECCCPPPPDVLPPRRGGRPSLQSASAAGRPAFARLADAPRARWPL